PARRPCRRRGGPPMTTDPFTEAARAEAERYVPAFTSNDYTPNGLTAIARLAHVEGWKAARTHLAAQEPTDAEVEAAAVTICSGEGGCDPCFNWDDSVGGGCTYCTRHARA